MGRIIVGISSWADPSLVKSGGFYPPGIKTPGERLRYYAGHFSITEIDSSFHFFPTKRNLELWLENTPEDFTFDVKAFSLFTQHPTPFTSIPGAIRTKLEDAVHKESIYLHHLAPESVAELWQSFASAVQPLKTARKLGLILFQFPPWFHFNDDNLKYLADCQTKLAQYPLAVEFRTADWLDEKNKGHTLDFLRQHGITLVCVDEPQGFRSSVPPVAEVTANFGFVRFHGRNAGTWETKGISSEERFGYLYADDELKEWVPKIRQMAGKASEIHVIFKNKSQDYPLRNARQMKALLE